MVRHASHRAAPTTALGPPPLALVALVRAALELDESAGWAEIAPALEAALGAEALENRIRQRAALLGLSAREQEKLVQLRMDPRAYAETRSRIERGRR